MVLLLNPNTMWLWRHIYPYLPTYLLHAIDAVGCSVVVGIPDYAHLFCIGKENKKKGCKYQELIQSSTTTDPGYHMGK